MRIVLDTNVVVSALLWDGAPRRLWEAGFSEGILFLSSQELIAELTEILSRPKFNKKIRASHLSAGRIADLYSAQVALIRPLPARGRAPDPDDDVVIGTAMAAQADLLVTGDRDLLFVAKYEGGQIVSVAEALHAIRLESPGNSP